MRCQTQATGTQATGTQATGTQDTGTQATGTQDTGTQATGTQDTGTRAVLINAIIQLVSSTRRNVQLQFLTRIVE